jgi:NTP pyrophosphatase (non-canonical NTP hydrolase)
MSNARANSFVLLYPEDWTPDNPDIQAEPLRYDQFVLQLFKAEGRKDMLNHAALGVCGEAGELADAIKKHTVYGKPADRENIIEELGDLRFFMQAVQQMFDISESEILQANCNKLAKRYRGLRYTDAAAITRADKAPGGESG